MHPEKAIPASLPRSFAGAHFENIAEGAGFSLIFKINNFFIPQGLHSVCLTRAFYRNQDQRPVSHREFIYSISEASTNHLPGTRLFLSKHTEVMQI